MSSPATPRVLVVIVNYNAGDWLLRAMEGLEQQAFRNFRTVIVDNASTAGALDEVLSRFPSVEAIRSPTNLGFAAANNLAVERFADGEWIALLNPDAIPEPGWLTALLDAAARHPACGSFASRTLNALRPAFLDGAGDAYHASGRYWRIGVGCLARNRNMNGAEVFSACAAAALYSREAWNAVGGFDPDYFCYGEDVDLGFRLRLAGYRCRYVPGAVAHHVGSAVTGTRSDFSAYHGQRNLVWTFVKNMPGLLFWALLPAHVVLNLSDLFALVLRGQGAIAWRAKLDALEGIPTAWRKRRAIQGARKARPGTIAASLSWGLPFRRC
jgi:GT2 family glycosyltransferase